jgi:hypothetical protein
VLNGTYVKGRPLIAKEHSMIVPINVSRKGTYKIRVEALQGNGSNQSNAYAFVAQGEFVSTGLMTVVLEGYGTPALAYNDFGGVDTYDVFDIYINDKLVSCGSAGDPYQRPNLTNKVLPVAPEYTFSCASITAKTNIVAKEAVNPATDVITLRVLSDVSGVEYHIYTDEVNGVKFEASGILRKGTQQIILHASGTPNAGGEFDYFIHSNSIKENAYCHVTIPVQYPPFTIQIYGAASNEWCLYLEDNSVIPVAIKNPDLFGLGKNPHAPVSVQQIKVTGENSNNVSSIPSDADMVLISYPVEPNSPMIGALYDFVINRDGVLVYSVENDNALRDIASTFYSPVTISLEGEGPDMMPLISGSFLVSGLFQNLEGKYVGRDGSYNYCFTDYTTDWINVCDGIQGARVIFHRQYPIILCGDGGFFSGGVPSYAYRQRFHPARLDSANNPVPADYGIYATNGGAYNSALMMNIIMWAIEYRGNK